MSRSDNSRLGQRDDRDAQEQAIEAHVQREAERFALAEAGDELLASTQQPGECLCGWMTDLEQCPMCGQEVAQ